MRSYKKIGTNNIELLITDPPYGVNFGGSKFYNDEEEHAISLGRRVFELIKPKLSPTAHLYIFIPTLVADRWISLVKDLFYFRNLLAFQAHNTNRYLKDNFKFDLQLVVFASSGKSTKRLNKVDWIPTSQVWLKDKRNKKKNPFTYHYPAFNPYYKANEKPNAIKKLAHPNQKSFELVKNFVLLSSNPGDLVIDPFAGSGTTLLAAEVLGRRWIGVELNEEFCEVIKTRFKDIELFTK